MGKGIQAVKKQRAIYIGNEQTTKLFEEIFRYDKILIGLDLVQHQADCTHTWAQKIGCWIWSRPISVYYQYGKRNVYILRMKAYHFSSLFISGREGKTFRISLDGTDSTDCGQTIPCRTIGFVLAQRTVNHDVVKLENTKYSKLPNTFTINRSFAIRQNITLVGVNGKPVISAEGPSKPTHLFEETEPVKVKFITLNIKNLFFRGVDVVRLINISSNISFQNCYFQNIVVNGDIIRIQNHPDHPSGSLVDFHQCHFRNNTILQSAVSIIEFDSAFHKCHFQNNLSAGSGLLFLSGGFITFKNSHFEKNTLVYNHNIKAKGGVIYATTNSVVEIFNCSFKKNEAAHAGAAVYTTGRKLFIKSSLFEHNTAFSSPKGFGGAICSFTASVTDISGSTFTGNKAGSYGGAIYHWKANLLFIRTSSFVNNTAFSSYALGGAIFTTGLKLVIQSSFFQSNIAENRYAAKTAGGAAYAKSFIVEIFNCSFVKNKATYAGGAVYVFGTELFIKSSLFQYNTAVSSPKGSGGAICPLTTSVTDISGSIFIGNKAKYFGGAICHWKANLFIKTSSFVNNSAFSSYARGGAIFTIGLKLIIQSSFFPSNAVGNRYAAKTLGGAAYAESLIVEILNCFFKRNKAITAGGALCTSAKKVVIRSSQFEYNAPVGRYNTIKMGGGGIYVTYSSIAEISNCSFKGNVATSAGGALYMDGKKLVIKCSLFENNTVFGKYTNITSGGAVYAYSIVEILNSFFKGNKASHEGGAIYHRRGKTLLIKSSLFEGNTVVSKQSAGSAGGAVSTVVPYSIAEILNCSYKGNSAVTAGGAIFSFKGKKLVIKSSFFETNIALRGGAVYTALVTEISDSTFVGNEANESGGAIHFYRGKLHVRTSSFTNNSVLGNGGAICLYCASICNISKSSFMSNKVVDTGGAISVLLNTKLIIRDSLFDNNSASDGLNLQKYSSTGGALNMGPNSTNSTCYIFNSSFQRNMANMGGAILFNGVRFTIERTSFDSNSVSIKFASGGAISTYSNSSGTISECSFSKNKAVYTGGAVDHSGGKLLIIKNSKFQNNLVLGKSGQGGALFIKYSFLTKYVSHHRYSGHFNSKIIYPFVVYISHCAFDRNQASFRGGAIMVTTSGLYIRNSSFQSSACAHSDGYSGGEFLYSKSSILLEHVSFLDVDDYNLQNSLIVHQNLEIMFRKYGSTVISTSFSLGAGVHIECLTGKKLKVSSHSQTSANRFIFISVSCSFCSENFYSLDTSQLDVYSQNESFKTTEVKCNLCPLGGVCEKGRIRAATNFWGYAFGKEVRFASCPFGYCCSRKECVDYFSCHTGRIGTLCGQCEEGLTENMVTPDCLVYKKCHHPWYSLVVIICGILYVTGFMYLNEITNKLKALLIPNFIFRIHRKMLELVTSKCRNKFRQSCQMQYLTDDIFVQGSENEERAEQMRGNIPGNIELVSEEEIQSIIVSSKDKEDNIFPALLKIIIFFYQTNVLLKIDTGSRSHGFVDALQEVVSTFFNLRIDGMFTQGFSWCPFSNLQPVSKLLLKSSFIVYLLFLISLAFILCKTGKLLKITGIDFISSRLLSCTLRVILIGYTGITATCFSLLSCVQLGHLGKVLFIDGSIPCYRWWQVIVIGVVCCWVLPFPITIYASSQLLHSNMVSGKQFFLCLFFPLPAVFYWLIHCHKIPRKECEHTEVLDQGIQEAIEIIEGPFQKFNNHEVNRSSQLP